MLPSAAAGRAAGDSVEPQLLVVGPQPVEVEVEHVVHRPHLLPLAQAEDPVGVAAVPADAVQLRRRLPLLGQELVYRQERRESAGHQAVFGISHPGQSQNKIPKRQLTENQQHLQ